MISPQLEAERQALHPRSAAVTARHLIPTLAVVVFAVFGPALGADPCASTDGPQFRCALENDDRLS